MEITIEELKKRGFKQYYNDRTYRLKLKTTNVIQEPIYLTLYSFETSFTWSTSGGDMEQFKGLKTIKMLDIILKVLGK
jgi:hypothetical protein|tara:strand:+ start:359 stop:592 length:234 start_codon:yes stop_codon:yes gene_type:complete